MKPLRAIRVIFWIAGAYDFLLGLAFLVAGGPLMERFHVLPPHHVGYVQFPALLLMVFGLMFFAVAAAPYRNHNLIPYGVLLKASYSVVVIGHWLDAGVEDLWKSFAVLDLVWLVLFAWAWRRIQVDARGASTGGAAGGGVGA